MALLKDHKVEIAGVADGVTVPQVYWKVARIIGGKDSLAVHVDGSKDGEHVAAYRSAFIPSVGAGAANFIAQAYQHLKTLPEFSGAEDV